MAGSEMVVVVRPRRFPVEGRDKEVGGCVCENSP